MTTAYPRKTAEAYAMTVPPTFLARSIHEACKKALGK